MPNIIKLDHHCVGSDVEVHCVYPFTFLAIVFDFPRILHLHSHLSLFTKYSPLRVDSLMYVLFKLKNS